MAVSPRLFSWSSSGSNSSILESLFISSCLSCSFLLEAPLLFSLSSLSSSWEESVFLAMAMTLGFGGSGGSSTLSETSMSELMLMS